MNLIKKILHYPLFIIQLFFVLLFIIYEELIWERFAEPISKYIKHLRVFKRLEIILNGVNRYVILAIFLLSFVVGELVGIASPIVAIKGYPILGVSLYILKLFVVAFAFWLFNTQKEKLLSFKFIEYSYNKITQFTTFIKNTHVFKLIKEKILAIKQYTKSLYLNFRDKINF